MNNKMQFGVMQRGVFDWDEDMPARFNELMEQARLLNELGYDSAWFVEHAFSDYLPEVYYHKQSPEPPDIKDSED